MSSFTAHDTSLRMAQVGLEYLQKTMVDYKAGSTDFYIVYQVLLLARM